VDPHVLALHSPHGSLQIFCRIVSPEKVIVPGRQHLRYLVEGHGFSGSGDGFWSEPDLRKFCLDLLSVKESHDGSAQLHADPERGGLTVEIGPGPDADTLAVVGNVAVVRFRTMTESDGFYLWRTDFGFSIRRDALPHFHKVAWISHYAV
jgi:hypothetical protein